MTIELILIRHGETFANVKKINQGQMHGRLTKNGSLQAKLASIALKDINIDEIYVSDLYRAKQTAKQIIKHHPKSKINYTKELREVNCGIFENTPYGTMSKYCRKNNLDRFTFKPNKGESLEEMKNRVIEFTKTILKKNYKILKNKEKEKIILFVTHGAVILNLIMGLLNIPDKRYKEFIPDNTGISKIKISIKNNKNTFRLLELNNTDHLKNNKIKNNK